MAPKPTPTVLLSPRQVRKLIAPLTTLFHPPSQCNQYTFIGAATDPAAVQYSEICAVFNFEGACPSQTPPACLPHVTNYSDVAGPGFFYSPGLICPSGWSTAASVAQGKETTGLVSGVDVGTLLAGETAVVCCPEGFTYFPAQDPIVSGACTKAVQTNPASYLSCSKGSVAEVTKTNIGESTAITFEQVHSDGSKYNKTTTLLFTSVEIDSPTIQINHRPVDLSRNISSPAPTQPPSTSQPQPTTFQTLNQGIITSSTTRLYPQIITFLWFAAILSVIL